MKILKLAVAGGLGVQSGTGQWTGGGQGGAGGLVPPLSSVLCLGGVGPAGWGCPA